MSSYNLKQYYYDFIFSDSSTEKKEILRHLKFEIDQYLFHYGRHFGHPMEAPPWLKELTSLKANVGYTLRSLINSIRPLDLAELPIFSNAYFQTDAYLRSEGFSVMPQPWLKITKAFGQNSLLLMQIWRIRMMIANFNLKNLENTIWLKILRTFKDSLKIYYAKFNPGALIIPSDMPFFESLACETFKELKRPSFIMLHGLPGVYTTEFFNKKAEYLVVWGEKIRSLYIKNGAKPSSVIVSGHPRYSGKTVPYKLRSSLEAPLVLTKSIPGGVNGFFPELCDRGAPLTYIRNIQKTLSKLGVKRAKLRIHPSENLKWFTQNLADDFFEYDDGTLEDALKNSSIVIGPTSSVYIDAIFAGVNYVVFEPQIKGRDILNHKVVPPFDGSEKGVLIAKDIHALQQLLKNPMQQRLQNLEGYIYPQFSLKFLNPLIRKTASTPC